MRKMTIRPLEEDFQRMGLSNREIRESLAGIDKPIGSITEATEAGVADDSDEEDFEDYEGAYLGDVVDVDDDDEDLDEMRKVRVKKTTGAAKRKGRQYYARHKAEIGRKTKRKKKTSAWKRHMVKLKKAPKGGPRTRRYVEDRSEGMGGIQESLLGDL
jgi:hypothetical protein